MHGYRFTGFRGFPLYLNHRVGHRFFARNCPIPSENNQATPNTLPRHDLGKPKCGQKVFAHNDPPTPEREIEIKIKNYREP